MTGSIMISGSCELSQAEAPPGREEAGTALANGSPSISVLLHVGLLTCVVATIGEDALRSNGGYSDPSDLSVPFSSVASAGTFAKVVGSALTLSESV